MDGNNYNNNNQNGSSDSFYSYNNGSQSNQQTEHANEGNVNQYNNSYQNTNSYSQNAGYQQGSAYQNGTYQNTGYQQNGAYQNGGYQNTNGAFYQNAQTTGKKQKKKRERKPGGFGTPALFTFRFFKRSAYTGNFCDIDTTHGSFHFFFDRYVIKYRFIGDQRHYFWSNLCFYDWKFGTAHHLRCLVDHNLRKTGFGNAHSLLIYNQHGYGLCGSGKLLILFSFLFLCFLSEKIKDNQSDD